MKAFISKILFMTMIFLLAFTAVNALYTSTVYYRDYVIDIRKYIKMDSSLDVVNLGNSHSLRAIDYSSLDKKKGLNMASPGQTLDYDYLLLVQYNDNLADNSIVLINVSHISLSENTPDRKQSLATRYYRVLSPELINDWKLSEYVMYGLFPILSTTDKLIESVKKQLDTEDKHDGNLLDTSASELREMANFTKENTLDMYSYREENLAELCRIIEFCNENGYRPVIITMPVTDIYYDLLTEEIIGKYDNSITYLKDRYDILVKDYSSCSFRTDYSLFYDISHLNYDGAIIFSEFLFKDLGIE